MQCHPSGDRKRRSTLEILEDRAMLAVTVRSQIFPDSAVQAHFAPGMSERDLDTSLSEQTFRFSTNGEENGVPKTFETLASEPSDAAIALYDANGNLIAHADADLNPNSWAHEKLVVELEPHETYLLHIIIDLTQPAGLILRADLPTESINETLALDPTSGVLQFDATSSTNILNHPSDVDYYQLDLLNASNGTVAVSAMDVDVQPFTSLYRRGDEADPWEFLSSGVTGVTAETSFDLEAFPNVHTTDAEYLVAVSPLGLATPGGTYRVAVSASTLSPATVSGPLPGEILVPSFGSIGQLVEKVSANVSVSEPLVAAFRSPQDSVAHIRVHTQNLAPVVSVYDKTGNTLLAVASRRSAATASNPLLLDLPTIAGEAYVVRVGSADGSTGPADVLIDLDYVPVDVELLVPVTTFENVPIQMSTDAHLYRIQPNPSADVLVVEIQPSAPNSTNAIAPSLSILGPHMTVPIDAAASAGEPLFLPVDISGHPGPFDLLVSATQGSGPVNVSFAQLEVPVELDIDSLEGGALNLAGDVSSLLPSNEFGEVTGLTFYNLISEQTSTSEFEVRGDSSYPLSAIYEAYGGSLRLVDWRLPDANGESALSSELSIDRQHAVVAIPLAANPDGSIFITVDGPEQSGIGVGMVPSDPPTFPSANLDEFGDGSEPFEEATGPFFAELNIRSVVLENEYEENLWRTILPLNVLPSPNHLSIEVDPHGLLGVTVDVLRQDGTLLTSITSVNGILAEKQIPITDVSPGETLLFRVRALPGQLDDGIYSLKLVVETDNPHPHEVLERFWRFVDDTLFAVDDPYTEFRNANPPAPSVIPSKSVGEAVDVVLSQLGNGFAEGLFVASNSGSANEVDLFRFRVPADGPLRVWTEAVNPLVDTNLRLYRRISVGAFDGLVPIEEAHLHEETSELLEVIPSFDWYPADRSEIDAQTLLNETADFGIGDGEFLYAVVKNQAGSQGQYRLHVDVAGTDDWQPLVRFPMIGSGSTNTQIRISSGQLAKPTYVPIDVGDYHDGSISLQSRAGQGQWKIDLFDDQGERLARSKDVAFVVPPGPQTVYARLEPLSIPDGLRAATFDATMNVRRMRPLIPAPAELPRVDVMPFPANQFGDGQVTGALGPGQSAVAYSFVAAPGPLQVQLTPSQVDSSFRWGVYVDGKLAAWDATQQGADGFVPESLWTEIYVPGEYARLPLFDAVATGNPSDMSPAAMSESQLIKLASRDVAFDEYSLVNEFVEVTIYIEPFDGGRGEFTIDVDSAAQKAMRDHDLRISARDGSQSSLTDAGQFIEDELDLPGVTQPTPLVSSGEWTQAYIPSGSTNVRFQVSRTTVSSRPSPFYYSIFDSLGSLVMHGQAEIPVAQDATIAVPNDASRGNAYYVQLTSGTENSSPFLLTARANISQNNVPPRLNHTGDFPGSMRLNRLGDGTHDNLAGVPLLAFWVGAYGEVTIEAESVGLIEDIELYRIHRTLLQEFPSENVPLVDHANKSGSAPQFQRTLTVDLDPGAYAVRIVPGQAGSVSISVNSPTPAMEELVLDPNFGINDLPGLRIRDEAKVFAKSTRIRNLNPELRGTLYRVIVPPGALGFGNATATALGPGSMTGFPTDEDAVFGWWRESEQGVEDYSFHFNPFTGVLDPTIDPNGKLTKQIATVQESSIRPGEAVTLLLDRRSLDATIDLTATFPVPVSGTPDLIVQPISLTPNGGETQVGITVTNIGYAPALPSTAHYNIRDATKELSKQWSTSAQTTASLGPFGTSRRALAWDPVTPDDEVEFIVDVELDTTDDTIGEIEELDELNNRAIEVLKSVNRFAPEVLLFDLADPAKDGTGPNVDPNDVMWGRYLSGIAGNFGKMRFEVRDLDDDLPESESTDLHQSYLTLPNGIVRVFGSQASYQNDFTPNQLAPTTGENPNIYEVHAKDIWGLESSRVQRTAMVVPRPGWLSDPPGELISQLKFNSSKNAYEISFNNDLVNYEKTLNQIMPFDVPFIGNKKNQFLVSIGTEAEVTLDPSATIFVPIEANAKLKVLGYTVFDETFDGADPITDHFGLVANLNIDPQTVEATAAHVGLRISELPLVDYESPEIKLFTYGIPGVASLNANLILGIMADLNAGLTLAFDPAALSNPLQLNPLGFSRPTFVGVDLNPSLTIEGEAELFGFLDIASLSGSIGLNFELNAGLENNNSTPIDIVEFGDFFSESGIELKGSLTLGTSASILGIEVWDYEWQSPPLFALGDDVYTWQEYDQFIANQSAAFSDPTLTDENGQILAPPTPITSPVTGSAKLGNMTTLEHPQLVLDGNAGLFLQAVDVGNGRANLGFAQRGSLGWTELTPISQPEHILNPTLSLTNDGQALAAVGVYQATAIADLFDPNLTLDDVLRAQELRYRYFDGTNWDTEKSLDDNGLYDANPSVSFNSQGQGALAWTRNTSQSPLRSPGSNELMVSLWNATNHEWMPPLALTNDTSGNVADSRPTVHMGEDGTATVAWLRNAVTDPTTASVAGSEIWYSQWTQAAWTQPAPLLVQGLPEGRITQLALGGSGMNGDGRERLDLLFAHTEYLDDDNDPTTTGDTVARSRLLNRTAWMDAFGSATAATTISQNANYSYLKTVNNPNGGLTAYWQQSDGQQNEIFASSIASVGARSVWSPPIQLTKGEQLEVDPVLAFDTSVPTNGQPMLQLLFDQKQELFSSETLPTPAGGSTDGIPMSGSLNGSRLAALPELTFSRSWVFPGQDKAATGTEVTGEATILNHGLAETEVNIRFVRLEDGVQLNQRTIVLGPGREYRIEQSIPIVDGKQTIKVQLFAVSSNGAEMVTTDNNTSSASINGLVDLRAESIEFLQPPIPGQTISLAVTVSNPSSRAITEPFVVAFFEGQHVLPLSRALDQQEIAALAANQSTSVTFSWTVPSEPGYFQLTAWVDGKRRIEEATELNNTSRLHTSLQPDVTVRTVDVGLLDYSGENNVEVAAEIANIGLASANNVRVDLWWRRNDGSMDNLNQPIFIPVLPPGEATTIRFIAQNGLAGNNTYRVGLAEAENPSDANRSNNAAQETMVIQGFADLVVASLAIRDRNPQQGTPVELNVGIENLGIDDAYHAKIEIFAELPRLGRRLIGETVVEHIAPLSAVQLSVEIDTSLLTGATRLLAVIDRRERILEISDLNNSRRITVDFTPSSEILPGDLDANGGVDFGDFLVLSANFGKLGATRAEGDIDGDGRVSFADFLLLSSNFGKRSR